MEHGEIVKFDVAARCPYCDEETEVCSDEFTYSEAKCQHCDKSFKILGE